MRPKVLERVLSGTSLGEQLQERQGSQAPQRVAALHGTPCADTLLGSGLTTTKSEDPSFTRESLHTHCASYVFTPSGASPRLPPQPLA